MEISEYKNIYQNEGKHFYYVTIHNLVISFLKNYYPLDKKIKILDAGCGTGLLAKKLTLFGKVEGVDISREALKFARLRGIRVKKASVSELPFKDNTFDVVVSIDVIYHREVKDDQKALDEFYRVLKPNGILILRVPANKWLNLAHDKLVYTARRYNKHNLQKKLFKAKFQIEKISFVNAVILPLAILQYIFESIVRSQQISSNIKSLPKFINSLLTVILSLEIKLLKIGNLPFGIGLIAVCRKPLGNKIAAGK